MIEARCSVGITLTAIMLALLPWPLMSAVKPTRLGETGETVVGQAATASRISKAVNRRIFSGTFVAHGQTSFNQCRWAETWIISAVRFDLSRRVANLSGRLVQTPLTAPCAPGNQPIARQFPISVSGTSIRVSSSLGVYHISIIAATSVHRPEAARGVFEGQEASEQLLTGKFVAGLSAPYGGAASGNFELPSLTTISLKRETLTLLSAKGSPAGGRFEYSSLPTTGVNVTAIELAAGIEPTTNPNQANLKSPENPNPNGAPAQGGLALITGRYVREVEANKAFFVATFGLSCYNSADESEWGTPKENCRSVTINGATYTGAVADPYGLKGIYCAAFIAEVSLQGAGVTRDGRKIQYDPSTSLISVVKEIQGADGTPVVVGRTLARDRKVVPRSVLVDIDGVGNSLVANDTGGAIKGYRIDLYKGAGEAVCANFTNSISIASCQPAGDNCPSLTIPE